MKENLFGGAGIVGLIPTTAYFVFIGTLMVVYSIGALITKAKGKERKGASVSEAIIGTGVLFGIPAAIAAMVSVPATAALIAMDLSPAGWIVIAVFAALLCWQASKKRSSGAEGCTKLLGTVMFGYAFVWAITALVMVTGASTLPPTPEKSAATVQFDPAVAVGSDAAAPGENDFEKDAGITSEGGQEQSAEDQPTSAESDARPVGAPTVGEVTADTSFDLLRLVLIAVPFWMLVMMVSGGDSPIFAVGFALFIAFIASLVMGAVDRGFAAAILPENQWLRYSVAGLATGAMASVPPLLINLKRSKSRRNWNDFRLFTVVFLFLGLLLGLLWAVTRLLF